MDLLHHYNDDDEEELEDKEDNNNNNDDDHCYEYSNINRIHDQGRHMMMNHDVVIGSVTGNNNNYNIMDLHNTSNQRKSFKMSPLTSTTTSGTTKRQRIESKTTIHHDHNYNQDVTKTQQHDRVQIVTETEYIAIQKQQDSDTIGNINNHHQPKKKKKPLLQSQLQSQPGRWSTHCSCRITLNQYELRQVDLYIQSLCHTIQDVYPNYIGYAIIMIQPSFPNRLSSTTTTTTTTLLQQQQHQQRKMKNQSRRKSSSSNASSKSAASTAEYHISLTRPDVALHTHHIDSFIKSLTYEIQQLSIITPFDISFDIPPTMRRRRHCRTTTQKIILNHHILHNTTHTKSFGIWRCGGNDPPSTTTTTMIRPLQQLSNCCNHVLTQQYQQVSYHYDDNDNKNKNTSNDSNVDQRTNGGNHQYQQPLSPSLSHNRRIDPIYHISLVRFEPCLYEYMNPTMDTTVTTTNSTINDYDPINDMDRNSNNDNNDDSSEDVDTMSSDDDSDDSDDDDDTTRNNLHYIDHVTCQFGGGAKVYHIPFSL